MVGIAMDKPPIKLTQYRSQGDTVPYIAAGTEKVGDIIDRNTAAAQQIGQVQSLSANDMSKGVTTGDADQGWSTDTTATAGSEIQLRVEGMLWAPAAAATYTDGQLVEWVSTEFVANDAGAHEVVGPQVVDGSTVKNILVRMNVAPRLRFTPP